MISQHDLDLLRNSSVPGTRTAKLVAAYDAQRAQIATLLGRIKRMEMENVHLGDALQAAFDELEGQNYTMAFAILRDALNDTRPTTGAAGVDGDLTTESPVVGRTFEDMTPVMEEGCDRD